jgi:hypothetical protein
MYNKPTQFVGFYYPSGGVTHFALNCRNKVSLFTGEADQVLQKKLEEKTIFLKALQKKYYKKDKGGWHVVIDHSKPEEEKTDRLMTLLLVDQELYQFTEIMLA